MRQIRFGRHIGEGSSHVEVYRPAGYAAYVNASRMFSNARVSRCLHRPGMERKQKYATERDELLPQLVAILRADPNEIARYHRVNCRCCQGENHKYQSGRVSWSSYRQNEWAGPSPDLSGGVSLTDNMGPNPDCPRCNGEGKEGIYGVGIMTSDKDAARRELIRLLLVNGADARQIEPGLHHPGLQARIDAIKRNARPDGFETGFIGMSKATHQA